MNQRLPSPIRTGASLTLLLLLSSSTLCGALAPEQQQSAVAAQTSATAQAPAPFPVRWNARPGVRRYRLQVARDRRFKDIVFDRIVMGYEYSLTELPPGSYFWRVAPARNETGRYSASQPMEVVAASSVQAAGPINSGTVTNPGRTTGSLGPSVPFVIIPPANSGWRTSTGEVMQPVAAHLRMATSFDLVGVNADGMIYALDGASGAALWLARYRPNARRGELVGSGGSAPAFTPLPVKGQNGLANLLVAYEGGVRALEGATGRELWRAALNEHALSGAVGTDESSAFIVAGSGDAASLVVLDSATGRIVSNTKLEAQVIGSPAPFTLKETRGVLLALQGGTLDMRGMNGERVRSIKMDTPLTTPPLAVEGQYGLMVLVGTESGLISLDAAELRPLGRIATEDDAPHGMLAPVDLNGDGSIEVVMLTRKGRLVIINIADGRIRWYTNGATDAASATFADLNKDGTLDVLVAGGANFALGFSGRDGSLLWRADEPGATQPAQGAGALRSLAIASLGDGAVAFLVGGDPAHTSLRAVALPNGAVKAAAGR